MTLLPQVREQLDAAAHRRVRGQSPRAAIRAWGWIRAIGAAIPVVTAVAIAVIAITSLHGTHGGAPRTMPQAAALARPTATGHPSPSQQAINAAVNQATDQTIHADHACQAENRGPTRVHGSPGTKLLSQLGVLRRPAIQSPTLQTLLAGGFQAGSRVYVDYIRLAQVAYGNAYYLIPEGNPSGRGQIPARCYTEMRTQLEHITARLPAGTRATALRRQVLVFDMMRRQTDQPGLCFAIVTTRHVPAPNGVDSACGSTAAFLRPGLSGGIGQGDRAGGQIFAAIVPDSVASVTLKFSASAKDPARTLTVRAINDVVVFKIPARTAHADFPSAIIRRSANGRIISSIG